MYIRNILCWVTLLSVPVTCLPQKTATAVPARAHPYYSANILPALTELVRERGRSRLNHLYVGRVEVFENGYHSVLVYWKENHALILWEPNRGVNPKGEMDPRYDLRDTRRYWDLKKDVVPTLSAVGESNYLLTTSDAREMVDDCVRIGTQYMVSLSAQSNKRSQRNRR